MKSKQLLIRILDFRGLIPIFAKNVSSMIHRILEEKIQPLLGGNKAIIAMGHGR